MSQQVAIKQDTAAPLKISGWSKAEGIAGAEKAWNYSIYLDLNYADGTPLYMQIAPFSPGTHDWEYAETIIKPGKPLAAATVHIFVRNVPGTAWFDDLFVGPEGGPNLLRNAGFEPADRTDTASQARMLRTIHDLHLNALHVYLPGTPSYWQGHDGKGNPVVRDFLKLTKAEGLGVRLTIGAPEMPPFKDTEDPNFPEYHCVNGPWGEAWVKSLGLAAGYDFAAVSLVPDEYNWLYYDLQERYANSSDPKVVEFYKQLPAMCNCPVCQKLYQARFGEAMPQLPLGTRFPEPAPAFRQYLQFRYDSTTGWLKRGAAAVKQADPRMATDSLICVTPLCTDDWWGPGIAWDRLGETGLDFPTTDPYIQLHNYLGDSTHWYVTETAAHLTAATPQRQCGIVLEASRLRSEDREIDPVEAYGSALSAVCHGAKELSWWHYVHITGEEPTTGQAGLHYAGVKGVYGLLEQADPWLGGLKPYQPVAVLYSRASDDWWRFYSQPQLADFLTAPPLPEAMLARAANIAQKDALYYLFRRGVPTEMFYLESVTEAQLRGCQTVLVPFPLAISDGQAQLLTKLAQAGKRVIVMSQQGLLDEKGARRSQPALTSLVGSATATRPRTVGQGRVWFIPGFGGLDLVANRDHQKRTRQERILPDALDPARTAAFDAVLLAACGREPWVLAKLLPGQDVEATALTNDRGELVVLTTNWETKAVRCQLRLPARGQPTLSGYRLRPDGSYVKQSLNLTRRGQVYERGLDLGPQEACLWRLAAK
jgi:hypothetical protein